MRACACGAAQAFEENGCSDCGGYAATKHNLGEISLICVKSYSFVAWSHSVSPPLMMLIDVSQNDETDVSVVDFSEEGL